MSSQKDFFTTPFSRFHQGDAGLADRFRTIDENIMGANEPGVACRVYAVEPVLSQAFNGEA